jgi:protein dithiol oxidoreductase (disulfide-forming)
MSSRIASSVALTLALALSSASQAAVVAGRDYTPLQRAQATQVAPNKTEIIEFFSFACPHCYELNRKLLEWARKLPSDVTLRRVPVAYDKPGWQPLAQAAYAMQATGDFDRLESAFFDAIHKERQPLFDQQAITAWMAKHGVDSAKFTTAWNSFGVSTHMAQNPRMQMSYEIAFVPMFVVDGRYIVTYDAADKMLANTSGLVEKVKAERKKG